MLRFIKFVIILFLLVGFSIGGNISINDISVRFCDDDSARLDKRASFYQMAGEENQGCIYIINKSANTGYIELQLLPQTKTNQGDKACSLPGNTNDVFVKYVKPVWAGIVYIGPDTIQKKSFVMNFPAGAQGIQAGCVAFFVVKGGEKTNIDGTMISMVSRKVNLFEIWVDDAKNLINKISFEKLGKSKGVFVIWNNSKFQILFDANNKYINLISKIKNIGNMDQKLSVSGRLRSIFAYNRSFSLQDEMLDVGESLTLDILSGGNEISIPDYQGFFRFKLNFKNIPSFEFDNSRIPKGKLEGTEKTFNILFFVVSRVSIIFWLVSILVVLMIAIIYSKYRVRKIIRK